MQDDERVNITAQKWFEQQQDRISRTAEKLFVSLKDAGFYRNRNDLETWTCFFCGKRHSKVKASQEMFDAERQFGRWVRNIPYEPLAWCAQLGDQ